MLPGRGHIVLMGSGELTATMVEVHKDMLGKLGPAARAVFLDTPAGFQLNVDQISAKAGKYFRDKVGHPMALASYKSKTHAALFESEKAFIALKQADFVLIGPGSPTYAVRQWAGTPIIDILAQRIASGACLVAASAAALTVGRFTLPVYEIYKVGEDLRWEPGVDILGRFGLNLVVVPHWNNAEGGTHDTRCCFMGEPRFRALERLLPENTVILGLEEHTACIIDLARDEVCIRGIGSVILRHAGLERVLKKNEILPLDILRGPWVDRSFQQPASTVKDPQLPTDARHTGSFWDDVHALESRFQEAFDCRDPAQMSSAILELDRFVWKASRDLESEEFISQTREILREWIVLMGTAMAAAPRTTVECLEPLVEELLSLRDHLRAEQRWAEADMLRECLQRADIVVEDTSRGARWRVGE
jgi:peptidase E